MKSYNTHSISFLNTTLRYALVLVFLSYYGCCVFSTHVHIDSARFVAHAHPYSSPDHQHTTADFCHLRLLNLFTVMVSLGVGMCFFAVLIGRLHVCVVEACGGLLHHTLALLRAPPAV